MLERAGRGDDMVSKVAPRVFKVQMTHAEAHGCGEGGWLLSALRPCEPGPAEHRGNRLRRSSKQQAVEIS